jgi:hypothetical protein
VAEISGFLPALGLSVMVLATAGAEAQDQRARVTGIVQPDHGYHECVYPLLLSTPLKRSQENRAMLAEARDEGIAGTDTRYQFGGDVWEGREQPCSNGSIASAK